MALSSRKKTRASAARPGARKAAAKTASAKRNRRKAVRRAAAFLTVRHYCQGIGDCHLLTFRKSDGKLFRMLIDCGVHTSVTGGSDFLREVVADLKRETGGRIDVLAITHEHWDHVSGFLAAREEFKELDVDAVWLPWTEDPKDPVAVELDKFREQTLSALQGVARRLGAAPGLDSRLFQIRNGIHAVLGFAFGAAGEKVRSARNAAIGLARQQPPVYCKPTDPPITIKGLPNLRIYVLGPPRSKAAIRLEEKTSEMYRLAGLERGRLAVRALAGGLAASGEVAAAGYDDAGPFDGNTGTSLAAVLDGSAKGSAADFIRSSYASGEPWRRIDDDWMGAASDLAMQLDRGVNNTSLVLAFEDIESERVYLFPGDAQIGSWLSWQDLSWPHGEGETRAADLLARTVYLKVAHHGSHNATPETKGLEMMVSADLSAFVPTNQKDAAKVGWGEMPFHSILSRLSAKTAGRVVRADDSWLAIEDGSPGFPVPSGSIRGLRFAPRDKARGKGGLWVEFDLA